MQVTQACIDMIKGCEGLRLKAYPDPASGGAPWTIGFGSTGPDVKPGVVWTEEQCEARLAQDLNHTAVVITPMINVALSDNEFSALVSFAYNLGAGSLHGSTLLKLVNAGDMEDAAGEFGKWNHAGGKVMDGLTKRRAAEAAMFKS